MSPDELRMSIVQRCCNRGYERDLRVEETPVSQTTDSDDGDWHAIVGAEPPEASRAIARPSDSVKVVRKDKSDEGKSTLARSKVYLHYT